MALRFWFQCFVSMLLLWSTTSTALRLNFISYYDPSVPIALSGATTPVKSNGTFNLFRCVADSGALATCPENINNVIVQCSVEGQLLPASYGGYQWTVQWLISGTDVNTGGVPYTGLESGSNQVQVYAARTNESGIYTGAESVPISCSVNFSGSGYTATLNNTTAVSSPYEVSLYARITTSPAITVTPPPDIRVNLGDIATTNFTVTVPSIVTSSVPFSWDVEPPCSDWSPTLTSSALPSLDIAIGHVTTSAVVRGNNTLTAKFTPTHLGEFSCLGTLRFTID